MSWLRQTHICDAPFCGCSPDLTLERAPVGTQSGPGEIAPIDPPDDWSPEEYLPRMTTCRHCDAPREEWQPCPCLREAVSL